jgi:mRNA-degrading endonuclease toxin of MazEF toxin-antitoxin module
MASSKLQRGQIWEVDLEPQSHKEEPGKRRRPALVVQTDLLNNSGHPTTIVVVGKGLADGVVEVRDRATGERSNVPVGEAAQHIAHICKSGT